MTSLVRRMGDLARRRRGTLTVVGTAGVVGALVVVLAGHWGEFARAAAGAPVLILVIAAALHVVSLLARSEAWSVSVRAAGGTVSRRRVYRAASVGYVGNLVNGEVGFAMRIAALRRSAPRETPKAAALAVTEVPILIMEGAAAGLAAFTLVGPLGLPWWVPLVTFAVAIVLLAGLRWLSRARRRGWSQGLAVMRDWPGRLRIAGLVGLTLGMQVSRNWLLLRASGVDASAFDAMAVMIAIAFLGLLPLGPSVGAGAAVLILGSSGVGAVAAAGALLTATGAAGALAYGLWALLDRAWVAGLDPRLALQRRAARAARARALALRATLGALPVEARRRIEHAYFGGLDHVRIGGALA